MFNNYKSVFYFLLSTYNELFLYVPYKFFNAHLLGDGGPERIARGCRTQIIRKSKSPFDSDRNGIPLEGREIFPKCARMSFSASVNCFSWIFVGTLLVVQVFSFFFEVDYLIFTSLYKLLINDQRICYVQRKLYCS